MRGPVADGSGCGSGVSRAADDAKRAQATPHSSPAIVRLTGDLRPIVPFSDDRREIVV
jgi:hypothetical protein